MSGALSPLSRKRDHHPNPDLRDMPVEIVLLHLPQPDTQELGHALDMDLAAESGYPHNSVLGLVYRVSRSVQFHACQSTGRRGTLLTPPPLPAGTSRWIRSSPRRLP